MGRGEGRMAGGSACLPLWAVAFAPVLGEHQTRMCPFSEHRLSWSAEYACDKGGGGGPQVPGLLCPAVCHHTPALLSRQWRMISAQTGS